MSNTLYRIAQFSLALSLLAAFAGIFLLSPEIDEAWILTSLNNLYELGLYTCEFLPGTRTTGGLHTLIGYFTLAAGGLQLPLLRFGPFLALVAIVFLPGRLLPQDCPSLIPASLLVAVPGTLALAGLAYGLFYAFLLLLLALIVWERVDRSWLRILICGTLCGLAAATRVNFVLIFPALVLWGLLTWRDAPGRLRLSGAVALWGFIVFQLAFRLLSTYSAATLGAAGSDFGGATGLDALLSLNYPLLLNKWVLVERSMSLPLLALGSLAIVWLTREKRVVPVSAEILLIFAWLVWGALLWASPLANLRYYWPALATFAIGMGLSLAVLYREAEQNGFMRPAIIALCLACTLGATATQFRHLVYGNSSAISHEWAGHTGYMRYRRFQAMQDHWQMVETLKTKVGKDEAVATFGPGFDLALFSGRRVVDWRHLQPGGALSDVPARWLLLSQMQLGYLNLDGSSEQWIQSHAKLVEQHGAYALYRLKPNYDVDVVDMNYRIYFERRHPDSDSIVQYR